jgi:hypothetical protein
VRVVPGRAGNSDRPEPEYKTIVLPFKFGIFKRGLPDVESALNKEGRDGWQFKQMVVQASSNLGESVGMLAIFERQIE